MSRSPFVLFALWLAGCEYDVGGVTPRGGDGPDGGVLPDARPDEPDAGREVPDGAVVPRPDAAPPLACPENYAVPAGARSAYRLGDFFLDWQTSEGACEDDGEGTHLAVIDDATELGRVLTVAAGNPVWIGLSDRIVEGSFLWVDGEPESFALWQAGEPNDDGLFGEDCVELRDGVYNDRGCGVLLRYVCECDGVPADPTAY